MQNRAKNPLNICLLLFFNPLKKNHFPANTSGGAEGSWECSWQLLAGDAQDTEVLLHQNVAEWVKEKQNPSTSSFVLKESLKAQLRAQLVKKKIPQKLDVKLISHTCVYSQQPLRQEQDYPKSGVLCDSTDR